MAEYTIKMIQDMKSEFSKQKYGKNPKLKFT